MTEVNIQWEIVKYIGYWNFEHDWLHKLKVSDHDKSNSLGYTVAFWLVNACDIK